MFSWKSTYVGSVAFLAMSALAHADGLVIVDGGESASESAKSVTMGADGHIVIGTCGFLALDNAGTLVGQRAGTNYGCERALTVRSDNWIVTAEHTTTTRPTLVLEYFNMFTGVSGGRTTIRSGTQPYSVVFQTDEKIIVGAGKFFWDALPGPRIDDWFMYRYFADFNPDISFGEAETGTVKLDLADVPVEHVSKITLMPNGSILASGVTQDPSLAYNGVLALYDHDGFPITSFGANGLVRFNTEIKAIDVDSSGKIYLNIGGQLVTRLNSDGSPDSSFVSPVQPAGLTVGDIKVDTSGRTVVFGATGSAVPYHGYVARLTSTGALDISFGGTGKLSVTAGQGVVESGGFGALDGGSRPVLALTVATEQDPGVPLKTDVAVFRFTDTGAPDVTFGAIQADADYYPDPFTFATKTVPTGAANAMSDPVTITGVVGAAKVTLESGSTGTFLVGCANSTGESKISAGQTICLMHDAASVAGGVVETHVNIGGRIASFKTITTNELADAVPDAFTFVDQPEAPIDATVQSNTLTITGLVGRADATVTGGSIGCFFGPTVNGVAKVANGDKICVTHKTSKIEGRQVSTTLTIGGVSDTFTSTATAEDIAPDTITFESKTGVKVNDGIASNAIRITGINRSAAVSVTDGQMSIGCTGDFTSAPGTITNGQQLCLMHTSATQPSTSKTTTVYVGTGSATFTSTTAAAASQPNPPPSDNGKSGGGGALDWLSLLGLAGLLRRALRSNGSRAP